MSHLCTLPLPTMQCELKKTLLFHNRAFLQKKLQNLQILFHNRAFLQKITKLTNFVS
jgi:hypothetical protein